MGGSGGSPPAPGWKAHWEGIPGMGQCTVTSAGWSWSRESKYSLGDLESLTSKQPGCLPAGGRRRGRNSAEPGRASWPARRHGVHAPREGRAGSPLPHATSLSLPVWSLSAAG